MAKANSKPYGRIYLVTNTANGKRYVGQTIGSIEDRWRVHCGAYSRCKALSAAITKHGAHEFTVEEVVSADTPRELNALERLFVQTLGTMAPAGYNLKDGGGSKGKWSEQMLRHLAETRAAPEYLEKAAAASRAMWARPDTRKKISDAIRAGLSNPEVRERRSAIAKVSCNTDEVRTRMSAGQVERFQNEDARMKIGADTRERWRDAQYREKMLAARAAVSLDPAIRAKVAASVKALWADPVYKARMTAAQQAGKAKKKALAAAQVTN